MSGSWSTVLVGGARQDEGYASRVEQRIEMLGSETGSACSGRFDGPLARVLLAGRRARRAFHGQRGAADGHRRGVGTRTLRAREGAAVVARVRGVPRAALWLCERARRAAGPCGTRASRRPRAGGDRVRRDASHRRIRTSRRARSGTGLSDAFPGRLERPASRRAEPRLPRARRDGRDGDVRPRAVPGAGRALPRRRAHGASSTARRRRRRRPLGELVPDRSSSRCDAEQRAEWVRGEQQLLPRLAGPRTASTSCTASPARRRLWGAFRRVVTIHDLIYRVFPSAHRRARARGMRVLVPLAARRSHRVIAVVLAPRATTSSRSSASCREDRRRRRSVLDATGFAPGPEPSAELRRASGSATGRVVLTLSAKRPHKNLVAPARGARAHPAPSGARPRPPRLPDPVRGGAARRGRASSGRRRRAPPRLGRRRGARGALPGGGLLRLPVALRGLRPAGAGGDGARRARRLLGRASLPEVAGDAALLFDPEEPRAIADAIERLLGDPRAAARLAEPGRERRAASPGSGRRGRPPPATSGR